MASPNTLKIRAIKPSIPQPFNYLFPPKQPSRRDLIRMGYRTKKFEGNDSMLSISNLEQSLSGSTKQ